MRGLLLVVTFVIGVAVGVAGTISAPRYAGQYLPQVVSGKAELVDGEVAQKQRQRGRLLLTVLTPQGAILATFKERVPEIDLLVNEGDQLTLSLPRYEPFVEDPAIERVRKGKQAKPTVQPPMPAAEAEPQEKEKEKQREKASR
ncbi:MAG: hypothetical protein ACE5JD_13615 [Candidatus Methylomirabilia bacterium]